MKINGKILDGPKPVIIPIPRGDEDIILKAEAVVDMEEFNTLCPRPAPPMVLLKGNNIATPQVNDPKFQKELMEYGTKRIDYMIVKSLEATDSLEWDTVDINSPDTYKNYEDDFKNAGLTSFEINRIVESIMEVNGLSDERIEEAKKRFLALAQAAENQKSTSVAEQ